MSDQPRIRLYFAPQSFPCGPQSSCCGPIGQSAEEVEELRNGLEQRLPAVMVETVDVSQPLRLDRDGPVLRILNSFGHQACPIVAVDHDIVSMGPPDLDELAAALKARLTGAA